MNVRSRWPLVPAVLALTLAMPLAGCGGNDQPPPPTPRPPSTVVPVTAAPPTPAVTATEALTATSATTTTFEPAQLPADGAAVVLQLARIDHSPWEPALLAQMTPHFSLQANGHIVFSHPGPDATGWYESVIPPEAVRNFVRIFADEIDVFDLATRHNEEPVLFGVGKDGAPVGCRATGVIFVRTSTREGRLVMSECDINLPTGPDKARIDRLKEVVNMVQLWKEGVNGPIALERQAAITTFLGWWSDARVPYAPASSVVYVTKAPPSTPADSAAAPRAEWPLDQAITDTLRAEYGARPGELLLGAPETQAVLAASRQRFGTPYGPRAWGPLFTDPDGHVNLVGIRPAVPGANEVVLDPYVYHAPPPDYTVAAR
ncbi:MAG: hypothetical protein ABI780_01100 [Ardenticatenales bacterium]